MPNSLIGRVEDWNEQKAHAGMPFVLHSDLWNNEKSKG